MYAPNEWLIVCAPALTLGIRLAFWELMVIQTFILICSRGLEKENEYIWKSNAIVIGI
jgi:hypothetical protein